MKLKVGDKVKIITGKEKGKEGAIIKTLKKLNQVVIEGLNIVKRHTKTDGQGTPGGIVDREAPINASNVKKIDNKVKNEKKLVKKESKVKITKKTKKVD